MRGSEDCEIYIVTSPEGFHYTHKIFVTDNNDDRHLVRGKTTDNTYLPEQYVKLLESNYDDNLLKAYRDGEFVNLSALSTYHTFNREKMSKNASTTPSYRFTLEWIGMLILSVPCYGKNITKSQTFGFSKPTHSHMQGKVIYSHKECVKQ